jgi:hypothetical protein
MACCGERKNWCVAYGETFHPTIRWGLPTWATAAITAIAQSTPVLITAPGHGIPDGWPVAVYGVLGMNDINIRAYPPEPSDLQPASVLDADTLTINDRSSATWFPYKSGGVVVFNPPVDLAGMSAIMTLWGSPDRIGAPLLTLTNGAGITIDTAAKTIIPEVQTAGASWNTAYYDLDVTDAGGIVSRLLTGILTID